MPALRLVALAAVLLAAPQLAEAQVDPCAAGKFFTAKAGAVAAKCTNQCEVPCSATGVVTVGDKTKDSTCGPAKCPKGQFLTPRSGSPSKCTNCPPGTFSSEDDASTQCTPFCTAQCAATGIKTAGDGTKDAVCGPASCPKGEKWTPRSGDAAATCTKCETGKFNDQAGAGTTSKQTQCAALQSCASTGVLVKGDTTKDNECGPTGCGPGFKLTVKDGAVASFCTACQAGTTFKAGTNSGTSCSTLGSCSATGIQIDNRGDTTQDHVCGPAKCAPGFYLTTKANNGNTFSKCTACTANKFNSGDDASESCTAHHLCDHANRGGVNGVDDPTTWGISRTEQTVCVKDSDKVSVCPAEQVLVAATGETGDHTPRSKAYCKACVTSVTTPEGYALSAQTLTAGVFVANTPASATAPARLGYFQFSALLDNRDEFDAFTGNLVTGEGKVPFALGDKIEVARVANGCANAASDATNALPKTHTVAGFDADTLKVYLAGTVVAEAASSDCSIARVVPALFYKIGESVQTACIPGGKAVKSTTDFTADSGGAACNVGEMGGSGEGKKCCPAGKQGNSGDSACEACPTNKYSAVNSMYKHRCIDVTACPDAQGYAFKPSTAQVLKKNNVCGKANCQKGQYFLPAVSGTDRRDKSTAANDRIGENAAQCKACPANKYMDEVGHTKTSCKAKRTCCRLTGKKADVDANAQDRTTSEYKDASKTYDRICAPATCPAGQGFSDKGTIGATGVTIPMIASVTTVTRTFTTASAKNFEEAGYLPGDRIVIGHKSGGTTCGVVGGGAADTKSFIVEKVSGTTLVVEAALGDTMAGTADGNDECVIGAAQSSCAACPTSKFSASTDNNACAAFQTCANGYKVPGTANTDAACGVAKCAKGEGWSAGNGQNSNVASKCVACTANTFSDTDSNAACRDVAACSTYGVKTAADAARTTNNVCGESQCPPGEFFTAKGSNTVSTCTKCADGDFKAGTNANQCAKHKACSDTGVKTPGTKVLDAVCAPATCPAKFGFTAKSSDGKTPNTCTACPSGKYSKNDDKLPCSDCGTDSKKCCDAGFSWSDVGGGKCTRCGSCGVFSAGRNDDASCASQKTCDTNGVATPGDATRDAVCGLSVCPKGEFWTASDATAARAASCTACPAGQYNDQTDATTTCKYHCNTQCTAAAGVLAGGAAVQEATCGPKDCAAGQYYTAGSGSAASTCKLCPSGKFKVGTNTEQCSTLSACNTYGVVSSPVSLARDNVCGPANCGPGEEWTSKAGNSNTFSKCTACPAAEFRPEHKPSQVQCRTRTACTTAQGTVVKGSATVDNVCGPATCGRGHYLVVANSGTGAAAQCKPCATGYYKSDWSHTANSCNACTKCADASGANSYGVATQCTATKDAVCVGASQAVTGCNFMSYFTAKSGSARATCQRCPAGKYIPGSSSLWLTETTMHTKTQSSCKWFGTGSNSATCSKAADDQFKHGGATATGDAACCGPGQTDSGEGFKPRITLESGDVRKAGLARTNPASGTENNFKIPDASYTAYAAAAVAAGSVLVSSISAADPCLAAGTYTVLGKDDGTKTISIAEYIPAAAAGAATKCGLEITGCRDCAAGKFSEGWTQMKTTCESYSNGAAPRLKVVGASAAPSAVTNGAAYAGIFTFVALQWQTLTVASVGGALAAGDSIEVYDTTPGTACGAKKLAANGGYTVVRLDTTNLKIFVAEPVAAEGTAAECSIRRIAVAAAASRDAVAPQAIASMSSAAAAWANGDAAAAGKNSFVLAATPWDAFFKATPPVAIGDTLLVTDKVGQVCDVCLGGPVASSPKSCVYTVSKVDSGAKTLWVDGLVSNEANAAAKCKVERLAVVGAAGSSGVGVTLPPGSREAPGGEYETNRGVPGSDHTHWSAAAGGNPGAPLRGGPWVTRFDSAVKTIGTGANSILDTTANTLVFHTGVVFPDLIHTNQKPALAIGDTIVLTDASTTDRCNGAWIAASGHCGTVDGVDAVGLEGVPGCRFAVSDLKHDDRKITLTANPHIADILTLDNANTKKCKVHKYVAATRNGGTGPRVGGKMRCAAGSYYTAAAAAAADTSTGAVDATTNTLAGTTNLAASAATCTACPPGRHQDQVNAIAPQVVKTVTDAAARSANFILEAGDNWDAFAEAAQPLAIGDTLVVSNNGAATCDACTAIVAGADHDACTYKVTKVDAQTQKIHVDKIVAAEATGSHCKIERTASAASGALPGKSAVLGGWASLAPVALTAEHGGDGLAITDVAENQVAGTGTFKILTANFQKLAQATPPLAIGDTILMRSTNGQECSGRGAALTVTGWAVADATKTSIYVAETVIGDATPAHCQIMRTHAAASSGRHTTCHATTTCCGVTDVGGVASAGSSSKDATCSKVASCKAGEEYTAPAGTTSAPWASTGIAKCAACASKKYNAAPPIVKQVVKPSAPTNGYLISHQSFAGYIKGSKITLTHRAGSTDCVAIGAAVASKTLTVSHDPTTDPGDSAVYWLYVKEALENQGAVGGLQSDPAGAAPCVITTPACSSHRQCDKAAVNQDGNTIYGVRTAGDKTKNAACGTEMCGPGEYYTAQQGSQGTKCTPCGAGTFKAGTNKVTSCKAWNQCSATKVAVPGSLKHDAVCGPTKCPPGYFYTKKTDSAASTCTACTTNTFNANADDSTSCATRETCTGNNQYKVKTPGDKTRDTVCGPANCPAGQGWTDASGNTPSKCTACKACQFNLKADTSACSDRKSCSTTGILKAGDLTKDNECAPGSCAAGSYFTPKGTNLVSTCTACPDGKFKVGDNSIQECVAHKTQSTDAAVKTTCSVTGVKTAGTKEKDAECGPTKCTAKFGFTAKSSAGAPSTCTACPSGKFSAKDDDQPCTSCASGASQCCDEGQYWTAKNGGTDARCTACASTHFKVGRNDATECSARSTCSTEGVVTAGDTTKNTVCGAASCKAGFYYTARTSDGKAAAKCTACPAGTFSAADNKDTKCAAHKKCDAKGRNTAGDATTDAVCSTVTTCPKGEYYRAKLGVNVTINGAACVACPAGFFNDKVDDSSTCTAQCTGACDARGVTPGDKTTGATCGVSDCDKGLYYIAKTTAKPAACAPCESGAFNAAKDKSTSCTKIKTCVVEKVKTAGDATKDAVCFPPPKDVTSELKIDANLDDKAQTEARAAIAKAITAAGTDVTVEKVKIWSDVAMTGIALTDIKEGSDARKKFDADVEAAVLTNTGLASKVQAVTATSRRRVLGATERRQLADGVKCSMAAEVPKSVAGKAASMVKSTQGKAVSVVVNGKKAEGKAVLMKVTQEETVNCAGKFGECSSTCTKTYTVTTTRAGAGQACPHVDGADVSCGTACKKVSYSYGINVQYSKITAMSGADVASFQTALATDLDAHLLKECKAATAGCDAACQAACTSATTVSALSPVSRRRQLQVGAGDTSAKATTAGNSVTSTSIIAALAKEVLLANAGAKVDAAGLRSTGKVAVDAPAAGGTTTQVPGKVAGATSVATSFALLCGAVVALLLQ
jgi:hypothetical protein